MEKVEKKLAELIIKEPSKEYKIIIVFDDTMNVDIFRLNKYKLLMHNILSTTITGEKIKELSKINAIISIENDQEMGIL